MTDEQINAAIAEACGWTEIGECESGGFRLRGFPSDRFESHRKPIPNYCTDLNAMHEAEETIYKHYHMWSAYYYAVGAGPFSLHVTARKKAEAFLKVVGKWEDGE